MDVHVDEFSSEAALFAANPVLSAMTPGQRTEMAISVFDAMRRALCLETRYLDEATEEFRIQLVSEDEKGDEVLSLDRITADASPVRAILRTL